VVDAVRETVGNCVQLNTSDYSRFLMKAGRQRWMLVAGIRRGMKVGRRTRENCSICSFVTFALCRTDKRNYTVRPEWYIPLHFHTRHTFSLLFLFPSMLLDSLSVSFPLFYTFPHFPHRMHRQPILVQFYHPQDSIVSSILLLLFCHRASLINSTNFVYRHNDIL
jgi:hypothetical protein